MTLVYPGVNVGLRVNIPQVGALFQLRNFTLNGAATLNDPTSRITHTNPVYVPQGLPKAKWNAGLNHTYAVA